MTVRPWDNTSGHGTTRQAGQGLACWVPPAYSHGNSGTDSHSVAPQSCTTPTAPVGSPKCPGTRPGPDQPLPLSVLAVSLGQWILHSPRLIPQDLLKARAPQDHAQGPRVPLQSSAPQGSTQEHFCLLQTVPWLLPDYFRAQSSRRDSVTWR